MAFSRQFRALLKFTGLWALPWMALGALVAIGRWVVNPAISATTVSLAGWIITQALTFGALGAVSGLYLGLLLAWLERGQRWERLGVGRIVLLSGLGGAAPPLLFAALGLLFGAPSSAYLPLVGLGLLSGVGSTLLARFTHAAAGRGALAQGDDAPRLPSP